MIAPIITPGIAQLIEEPDELLELVSDKGSIDLIDLDQYRKNLTVWKEVLTEHAVETYLAHKATKSPSVLRATLEAGAGIDVSSLGELESALAAGFTADRIECTGPKNNAFLTRAARLGCLISIDSIEELERLITLQAPVRILIRIADPNVPGRTVIEKRTKFGVRREHLERTYDLLRGTKASLEGFHVHMDGFDPQMRAAIGEGLIELVAEAREHDHRATRINLGGGIKAPRLKGTHEWQRLMQNYEHELIEESHERTWNKKAYGMRIGGRNTIEGRAVAEMPAMTIEPITYLEQFLSAPTSHGVSFARLLLETDLTLMLEP
jgi:diaminopimelate decarboxylase